MPRPRRPNTNKSLPKPLQSSVGFEYWGRKYEEVFTDEIPFPSPTHLTVGSPSQSEAESLQFIEYLPANDTDELPPSGPYADNFQPSSSSSSYHPSRQRSKKTAQNTSRSTTNDLAFRSPRQSPRQRKSRRPRHTVDNSEVSQISLYNDPSLSSASLSTSLQRELNIESTDHDRCPSATSAQESLYQFPSEPGIPSNANIDQVPASFSSLPQPPISIEPPPILPRAGATGSSHIPIQRPAPNLGTQTGSFPREMDPYFSGDTVRANLAAAPYPFSIPESPPQDFYSVSPLTDSTSPFTWMDPSHVSSSLLNPIAQPGYHNQNFNTSDSSYGETSFNFYHTSSDSYTPPSQPISAYPQVYSGMHIDNLVGTHSTYSAAQNRSLSHISSAQTISSSSQLAQTTQSYLPTFGVDANLQDSLFLPDMNLPRSYDVHTESHGISQGGVYSRSQRLRHASPGLNSTYANTGHNHLPNAIATSSISRSEQKLSSSVPLTDPNW